MSQFSIQDIAAGIDRRFWSPRRLNALFMSQVMKDGETMRNLIHGGDQAASDAVLQALIAYYESRDKGQLIERMAQIGLDYPFIGFWKQRQEDKNRDESQPLREELETMKRLAAYSAVDPDKFWADDEAYEKAVIFAKYYGDFFYYSRDGHYIVDGTVPVAVYENKMPYTLFDGTYRESRWLDLSLYDKPQTLEVRDLFAAPFPQRKYVNATVIDVLRKTAASRKMANYERPYTGNGALDKVCNEIYDETALSAPKFVKAITLLNRRLADALNGKGSVGNGDFDAAAMLIERSRQYFSGLDYAAQFGFYKSEAGKELMKFSFMTTFTRRKRFDEQAMNNYVEAAANAGHWMNGQQLITKMILKNTRNLSGINRGLLELNIIRPRPEKFYGMDSPNFVRILNEYYDRDLERMNYGALVLKIKPDKKANRPLCLNINRRPER